MLKLYVTFHKTLYANIYHTRSLDLSAINIIMRAFANWKLAINGAINIDPCEKHFNCGNQFLYLIYCLLIERLIIDNFMWF